MKPYFLFSPILYLKAKKLMSVTCTRTEYREKYISGTKPNPDDVINYEIALEIQRLGKRQSVRIDNKECSEYSFIRTFFYSGIKNPTIEEKYMLCSTSSINSGRMYGYQLDGV